jgi:hypothetical protein
MVETDFRPKVREGPAVDRRFVPIDHLHITATTIGAAQELFTVRPQVFLDVTQLAVVNLTSSTAALSFYTVPPGDVIGIANAEFIELSVPPFTALDVSQNIQGLYKQGTVGYLFADTTAAFNVHGKAEEGL